jgi:hypothetical protein
MALSSGEDGDSGGAGAGVMAVCTPVKVVEDLSALSYPDGLKLSPTELVEMMMPPRPSTTGVSRGGDFFYFSKLSSLQFMWVKALSVSILAVMAAETATAAEVRARAANKKRKSADEHTTGRSDPLPPVWRPTNPVGKPFNPCDTNSVISWHLHATTAAGHSVLSLTSADRVSPLTMPTTPTTNGASASITLTPACPTSSTNSLANTEIIGELCNFTPKALLDVAICMVTWISGGRVVKGTEWKRITAGQHLVPLLIQYARSTSHA